MTRRVVFGLCTLVASIALSGCFTGERPHFNTDPLSPGTPTGDAAIDAVLTKLDNVTSGPATALYAVLTKFGNTTVTATVILDDDRRAIEVDTTRYLDLASQRYTCSIDAATTMSVDCTDDLDAARISNVGITLNFYGSEAAARLRRDAQAQTAEAVAHTESIANQDATCVSVTVTGGTAVYCVLSNGLLAKLDDGDVLITLGLLVPTVENAKLIPPNN